MLGIADCGMKMQQNWVKPLVNYSPTYKSVYCIENSNSDVSTQLKKKKNKMKKKKKTLWNPPGTAISSLIHNHISWIYLEFIYF